MTDRESNMPWWVGALLGVLLVVLAIAVTIHAPVLIIGAAIVVLIAKASGYDARPPGWGG